MKRLYSFMLSMAIAICASAQYKSSVWMVPDDMYMGPQIAFNFSSVCRNMGVDREEFGPILKQWLDPNRNKKTEYENIRLMYVSSDNGRFRLGDDTHGSFNFQTDVTDPYSGTERPLNVWGGQAALDLKNNTLCFNLYLAPAAVMGLYVERRCSTIREDTSETRMRPQPSRQGMPEPAGTQKRQRKSRWESNSFLLTKHIFYHSHRFSAVCAFTGKQKRDQPTAFLQSASPIQTVIIAQR